MAIPVAVGAAVVIFFAVIGDGPNPVTQVSWAHKLYEHKTRTVPARDLVGIQLQAKDHFSGVCYYG